MSRISYIAFPRALNAFLLSDIEGKERDFGITYNTEGYRKDIYLFSDFQPDDGSSITIVDIKGATFGDCFTNKFIYELYGGVPYDLMRKSSKIAASDLDEEIMRQEFENLSNIIRLSLTRSIHDFIQRNTEKGEFVEIYRVWTDHIHFNFGSPTCEVIIELGELLSPFDSPGVLEYMKFTTWTKFTIVNKYG